MDFSNTASVNREANNLLKQQQSSNETLNTLLEQSLSALSCGPDCQKTKTTNELNQKYLDSQTNMETAPIQLDTSKKIIMFILKDNHIMII